MWNLDQPLFNLGETSITPTDIIQFILILTLTMTFAKLAKRRINRFTHKHQLRSTSGMTTLSRLIYYAIVAIGIFVAFTSIGIDLTTLSVIVGALSVGVGFGLQAIFNNFACGIIMLAEKNIHVGSIITLSSGQTGTVQSIKIRTTQIKLENTQLLIVPNSELINKQVIIRAHRH